MADTTRIPGMGWYWGAAAIVLATLVAVGGIAVWLFLEYEAAVPFLAPGRHTVELKKPGSYLVWNDFRTVFKGRSYDEPRHLPHGAQISVIDKSSGQALSVGSYSGATSTTGSTESIAVVQFSITQPGLYEIVVAGDFPQRVFSVGRNLVFHIVGAVSGAIALVFVGFGAALAVAGWAFLRREEARAAAARAHPTPTSSPVASAAPGEQSLKRITAIVYGLQIAAFLVGITFIAAVIVNYVKRRDVEGTWLESHFRWQIRTFWYGLLWSFLGVVLLFVLVGFFVLMASAVWVLYRAIKGWIHLEEGKPMYA